MPLLLGAARGGRPPGVTRLQRGVLVLPGLRDAQVVVAQAGRGNGVAGHLRLAGQPGQLLAERARAHPEPL